MHSIIEEVNEQVGPGTPAFENSDRASESLGTVGRYLRDIAKRIPSITWVASVLAVLVSVYNSRAGIAAFQKAEIIIRQGKAKGHVR
jgi:hypothetical protein